MPGTVQQCNSLQEAKDCVTLYKRFMEDKSYIISVDEEESFKVITGKVRSGSYLFVYKVNGRVRGWILATKHMLPYFKGYSLYIEYYCSDLLGFGSILCMKQLHDKIVDTAKTMKIARVVCTCSWFDVDRKYARALKLLGWKIDNGLCVNDMYSTI